MSRLYDRVLAYGCRAFRPDDLQPPEPRTEVLARRRALIKQNSPGMSAASVERVLANFSAQMPRAVERFEPAELDGAPVIAADQVAGYCEQLPRPLNMDDIVSAIAPPFERFFVEFQGVNTRELHAWGVLFSELEPEEFDWDDKDAAQVGWEVRLTLIVEPAKGAPVGPVATYLLAVARDGLWLRHPDGKPVLAGQLVEFVPAPPPGVVAGSLDEIVDLVFPALLTVSFMHCRNVSVSESQPPAPLSQRWQKRRGRPLVSYRVLDIAPMREILDREGEAQTKGLRHALHICRGHFKTFNADSPLFGRHVGSYWWASNVRGSSEDGRVVKDYAVELDSDDVGRGYREAQEAPGMSYGRRAHPDPDVAGRGLAAHNRIQNALAQTVRAAGHTPRSPSPSEPKYDLGWKAGEGTWVAEVKSITVENEERQLRLGLGQVARYRHQLAREHQAVHAVIAIERAPYDPSWLDLCREQDIVLVWPDVMKSQLFP
jgi:hypothetical protein